MPLIDRCDAIVRLIDDALPEVPDPADENAVARATEERHPDGRRRQRALRERRLVVGHVAA